jgi:NAD+-dependent protein deacetylase sirtuin 5
VELVAGVPTFRDAGGLWRSYDATSLGRSAKIQVEFGSFIIIEERSSAPYLCALCSRITRVLKAAPNAGHLALAVLAVPEHLNVIASVAQFTLVTQNAGGLSVQAFRKVCPFGEPELIFEMHGNLFDTICTVCGDRETNFESLICPAFASIEELGNEPEVSLNNLPRCDKCAGAASGSRLVR